MAASHQRSRGARAAALLAVALVLAISPVGTARAAGAAGVPAMAGLEVLARGGKQTAAITDGDTVTLRATLAEDAGETTGVSIGIDGGPIVGTCTVGPGKRDCTTEPIVTLGWHWTTGGVAAPTRQLTATAGAQADGAAQATASLDVKARPVVLVHGLLSTAAAWEAYLGPEGFLARQGIAGFAVGDGQAPGTLRTGNITKPDERTNTLFENAAQLAQYIAGVKQQTGAEMVDLVGHSMGGLISRAYLDRLMGTRDVAQLLVLGTPMAGVDCAHLMAPLGLYLPASLEIRPAYVQDIFNRQVTHRHGVAFRALAGTLITDGFRSPCGEAPSDLAVSLGSAEALPLASIETKPLFHGVLNSDPDVFADFVLPNLTAGPGSFPDAPDPDPVTGGNPSPGAGEGAAAPVTSQGSKLFSGHVDAGGSDEVIIPIDTGIGVAAFALFDTTRSLQVTVTGASGKVIELRADKNGLVQVDDPGSLLTLGYGFANPKPGAWKVRLSATDRTPAAGADYALSARFEGGATLVASVDALLPQSGQTVTVTGNLRQGDTDLVLATAQATLRRPDGGSETIDIPLDGSGPGFRATVVASAPGVYGLDVLVSAKGADGAVVERTVYLAFEAQAPGGVQWWLVGLVLAAVLLVIAAPVVLVVRRLRRGRVGAPRPG